MMKRRFIPVGQGAFYHEQFDINGQIVNVVYDCGSSTPGFDIEQEIKNRFQKDEEISIVFISHLHTDHVNGLVYLLDHCKVKNIVFPLSYPEDKILLEFDCLCSSANSTMDERVYEFIDNPSSYVRERYQDTYTYAVINAEERNDYLNQNNRYREEVDAEHILLSGENILEQIRCDDTRDEDIKTIRGVWEYVPFNFRSTIRRDAFYKALSAKMGDVIDETNIDWYLYQWNDKIIQEKIIEAYENVNKDLNVNSMTLFSGTRDSSVRQRIRLSLNCFFPCKHYLCQNKENGCLYLGDYNAKGSIRWRDLRQCYDEYWNYIGCVQIPHHGSSYSYNHELALLDAFHIISAGKSNRYRHPHLSVIMDFLHEHKFPYIVTDDKATEIILNINF